MVRRPRRLVPAAALAALAGASVHAADAPPPRERDCARWADGLVVLRRVAEADPPASGVPASVYADRVPNLDPAVGAVRRGASLELLHCEQLNLKDKLDYLIRRLGR